MAVRSWIVLLVVTMTLCLDVGIIKGFSVLLPDLKEQLSSSTWVIGSAIGIISGWGYVLGLSANLVVKIVGARYGMMLCGVLSSCGLIICACATHALVLLAGQLLTGFVLLQENIAVGVVSMFFTGRQYDTAASIYSCGTGLGIAVIPLLTQMFLEIYGWRGSLLLLSGLCLQSVTLSAFVFGGSPGGSEISIKKSRLLLPDDADDSTRTDPMLSKDKSLKQRLDIIAASVGADLLIRESFIAHVLIPGFAWGYSLSGWMIYIVSFALSKGKSMRESTIVATCGGFGILLTRIPILPILHMVITNKSLVYLGTILTAVSLILTAHFVSLEGMACMSVTFGIGMGILGAELYIAAKDVVNKDEIYKTVAWLHLSYGCGSILSGFMSGLLFDVTGSFTISFYVMASASLLTVVSFGLQDISEILNNQWRIRSRPRL